MSMGSQLRNLLYVSVLYLVYQEIGVFLHPDNFVASDWWLFTERHV